MALQPKFHIGAATRWVRLTSGTDPTVGLPREWMGERYVIGYIHPGLVQGKVFYQGSLGTYGRWNLFEDMLDPLCGPNDVQYRVTGPREPQLVVLPRLEVAKLSLDQLFQRITGFGLDWPDTLKGDASFMTYNGEVTVREVGADYGTS